MSKQKRIISLLLASLLIVQPALLTAAPGTLSQDPLFIGSNVQPNILFVLDDSGSMGWEILKTNNADTLFPEARAVVDFCAGTCTYNEDGSTVPEADCRAYVDDELGEQTVTDFPNSGNLDFTPNKSISRRFNPPGPDNTFTCQVQHFNQGLAEMLELCAGYNTMAYNPNRTYTAWEGKDEDGIVFGNKTLTTALNDPYDNDDIDNLESHFYMIWNDDGDGVYEAGECPTNFDSIDNGNNSLSVSECAANPLACVNVSGLSAEQQQNYANWYSYYRKREYVAKKALSEVITQATSRMGLATIDDDDDANKNLGVEIRDVDDVTTPVNATAQANKETLLDTMFQINSSGNTPLRNALELAGNYFEQDVTTDLDVLFGFTPTEYGGAGTLTSSPIFNNANGGSCQKNFTVLLSDGFWNGGDPSVGNTDGPGAGDSNFDGGSFADDHSNTLADVAMDFYERDLAPALNDNLITSTDDPNSAQHMVTYTVAFGVNGTLSDDPPNTTDAFTAANGGPWPQPQSNTSTTIDDMRHAAWNGRGQFLSAANPQELIDSFNDTFDDIQSRVSSAASVSFNSTSLDNGALLFRAEFNPVGWFGDIQALEVTTSGVGSSQWSAASGLNSASVTASSREIISYNGTKGVPFAWPADPASPTADEISVAQVSDLLTGIPADVDINVAADVSAYGSDLVDFLRGDFSNEGVDQRDFRARLGSRLGDIVHSAPVFVGSPNARYPNDIAGSSNPYSTFISSNLNRTEMVYVGANDGMLHGFNANTGAEVFGYIPNFLFSTGSNEGLHYLADEDYTHRSYVDLTPTAGDVFIGGAWRTYLVGGARAGGKGIFVLDITNPGTLSSAENNADNIVKMEFTDPDLGFTYSQITIAKMNNGKWAAIFGNGYNNTGDYTAKIFVLYLDGSGHVELETNVGESSSGNGMSTPEVLDLDGNGTADRIYAGDLFGNLWAFDVSSGSAGSWGRAYGSSPLFSATDSGLNNQPITSKPSVVAHPTRINSSTAPNLLVTFGTGQYLTDSDPDSTRAQSFYGIWDAGQSALDRSDLQFQTLTTESIVVDSETVTVRTNTSNEVDYMIGSEMGWGIDLPVSGERHVVNPVVLGEVVFFNTLIPEGSVCAFGGSGFLMNVSLLNGGQPPFRVIDIPNNTGIYSGIASDGVPTAPTFVSNKDDSSGKDADRYVNTSRGISSDDILLDGTEPGRTSWTNLTR